MAQSRNSHIQRDMHNKATVLPEQDIRVQDGKLRYGDSTRVGVSGEPRLLCLKGGRLAGWLAG